MYGIIAAVAIGGALQSWGAFSSAKARAKALREQAERQAKAYESEAAGTLQQGEYAAGVINLKGANVLGDAKVIQSAGNLDDGQDALRKTAYMTALDAAMARANARRAAWGLQVQAYNTRKAGQAAADATMDEGRAKVFQSLIGTGASLVAAGAKYYKGGGDVSPGGSYGPGETWADQGQVT